MSELKIKVEQHFEHLGRLFFRNPVKTLLVVFLFIGWLIAQIPNITIDTSSEAMLHEDDPSRIQYDAFRDQFGGANMILVGVTAHDIFSRDFFLKLKALHQEIEQEVPFVQEVTSLINARNTRGEGDVLYVDDLLKGWPEQAVDLADLKKQVMRNPVYRNNIISEDGRMAAIVIETAAFADEEKDAAGDLSDFGEAISDDPAVDAGTPPKQRYFSQQENQKLVAALMQVVSRHDAKDFSLAVTGGPVVVDIFNGYTGSDMKFLFLLASGIIIFFIAILFQRVSGVILPFVVVYSSLASTLGLMALCNVYITLMSVVLPSFLLSVGIADSIHILAIFYRRFQQGDSKEEAVVFSMGHSGLAVVLTSLTTAAGLLSFAWSELSAIGNLGVFAAIGVTLALVYTLTMLPAFLALIPIKRKKTKREARKSAVMDRFLLFFARLSTSHPGKIAWLCPILFGVSFFYISRIDLTHHLIEYFPDSFAVKQNALTIDREMRGMLTIEVVIDTKRENGIYNPDVLNRVERISEYLDGIDRPDIFVGKVFSINDILKETHQALHGNDAAYYTIPQDRKTIAQELLLFENSGSDDLERIVDSRFSKTRITIKVPWVDLVIIDRFVKEVRARFQKEFSSDIDVTITGLTPIMGKTMTEAMYSMARSYIVAFIVISVLMVVLVGDIRLGMLSMIPNLLPIVVVIGIMGMAKVPMDMTALMIGSIAIGLVVDDTMHFMYNFRKYFYMTGDAVQAVESTLLGTGRAMLFTSIILSSSFFILMTATLRNSITFGFYTGLAIVLALLADFLIAPAIMTLVTRQAKGGVVCDPDSLKK